MCYKLGFWWPSSLKHTHTHNWLEIAIRSQWHRPPLVLLLSPLLFAILGKKLRTYIGPSSRSGRWEATTHRDTTSGLFLSGPLPKHFRNNWKIPSLSIIIILVNFFLRGGGNKTTDNRVKAEGIERVLHKLKLNLLLESKTDTNKKIIGVSAGVRHDRTVQRLHDDWRLNKQRARSCRLALPGGNCPKLRLVSPLLPPHD